MSYQNSAAGNGCGGLMVIIGSIVISLWVIGAIIGSYNNPTTKTETTTVKTSRQADD